MDLVERIDDVVEALEARGSDLDRLAIDLLRIFKHHIGRDGPYAVLDMLVDEDGNGPVNIEEARLIIFEIWDMRTFETVSHVGTLAIANNICDEMNLEYYDEVVRQNEDNSR